MNINQAIQDLLYDHQCVILPEFGGFVSNYKAAFIHPKKQMVMPPSKHISFNVNLKNNDGLLANFISQKEGISYEVAMDFVSSTIAEYEDELSTHKRLSLDGIGWISVNQEGALEFSPEETHNFLTESFGLHPVFLPTLTELAGEQEQPAEEVVQEEPQQVTPVIALNPEVRPSRRKWIAAAALVPLFMFLGGVQLQQNSAHISSFFSSIWPSGSTAKTANFIPRIEGEKLWFKYDDSKSELALVVEQNPELQSVFYSFENGKISPEGMKVNLGSETSASGSETFSSSSSSFELYFIVAGCFQEKSNADGLVKKLRRKGFDAGIFGKKGKLHMVCYGSYNNRTAAKNALSEIKSSENAGAWLKKH